MLIGPHESQISYDQHNHSEVLYQLHLSHFLMEDGHQLLSFLSQLIQRVLLLLLDVDRLSTSLSLNVTPWIKLV